MGRPKGRMARVEPEGPAATAWAEPEARRDQKAAERVGPGVRVESQGEEPAARRVEAAVVARVELEAAGRVELEGTTVVRVEVAVAARATVSPVSRAWHVDPR